MPVNMEIYLSRHFHYSFNKNTRDDFSGSTLVDIFFTVSTALALYKLSESTFVDIPLTVSTCAKIKMDSNLP